MGRRKGNKEARSAGQSVPARSESGQGVAQPKAAEAVGKSEAREESTVHHGKDIGEGERLPWCRARSKGGARAFTSKGCTKQEAEQFRNTREGQQRPWCGARSKGGARAFTSSGTCTKAQAGRVGPRRRRGNLHSGADQDDEEHGKITEAAKEDQEAAVESGEAFTTPPKKFGSFKRAEWADTTEREERHNSAYTTLENWPLVPPFPDMHSCSEPAFRAGECESGDEEEVALGSQVLPHGVSEKIEASSDWVQRRTGTGSANSEGLMEALFNVWLKERFCKILQTAGDISCSELLEKAHAAKQTATDLDEFMQCLDAIEANSHGSAGSHGSSA